MERRLVKSWGKGRARQTHALRHDHGVPAVLRPEGPSSLPTLKEFQELEAGEDAMLERPEGGGDEAAEEPAAPPGRGRIDGGRNGRNGGIGQGLIELQEALRKKEIWAIGGGKGGIGKSLITGNIGITLARMKKRVLLVDADLGGGQPPHDPGDRRPGADAVGTS